MAAQVEAALRRTDRWVRLDQRGRFRTIESGELEGVRCACGTAADSVKVNQMLRNYDDIRSRIRDAIRRWDDNGVPRYCDFSPEACGVYDVVAALVEVGCQACMERFRVVVTFDRESLRQVGERYALPAAGNIGTFRYGDPPFHSHGTDGCVGNNLFTRRRISLVPEHLVHVLGDLQHGVDVPRITPSGSERTTTASRV